MASGKRAALISSLAEYGGDSGQDTDSEVDEAGINYVI